MVVACWLGITKAREGTCPPLPPCSRSQNHPRQAQHRSDFLASVLLFLEEDDDDHQAR